MTPAVNFQKEVDRFRQWAEELFPEPRYGEWECDYPEWGRLYAAFFDFTNHHPIATWTLEQWDSVLYVIARDNESTYLISALGEQHPELILPLASAAIKQGEPDAKWQLAVELGSYSPRSRELEELLLELVSDTDEYVRRRAIQELARIHSPRTEEIALTLWHQQHENQQWARIAVLWSLHHIHSPLLDALLIDAEADTRPYLSDYARRMKSGEIAE